MNERPLASSATFALNGRLWVLQARPSDEEGLSLRFAAEALITDRAEISVSAAAAESLIIAFAKLTCIVLR